MTKSELYLDKLLEYLKFNFLYAVSMETTEYFTITTISTGETTNELFSTMIAYTALAFCPILVLLQLTDKFIKSFLLPLCFVLLKLARTHVIHLCAYSLIIKSALL